MPKNKAVKKKPTQKEKDTGRNTENRSTSPPATRGKRRRNDEGERQGIEKRPQPTEEENTSKTVTSANIPNVITTVLKSLSASNSSGAPKASSTAGASSTSNLTPTRAANDEPPRPLTTEDISAIVTTIVNNHAKQPTPRGSDTPSSSFSDLGKHLS